MRYCNQLFIIILLALMPTDLLGETNILSESYTYTIHDLESYSTIIEVEGVSFGNEYDAIPFAVAEFTELVSYALFVNKKGKWKKVNSTKEITTSTISYSSFFTGTKNYFIKVPSNTRFLLHVELNEKYPVFLSRMNKGGSFGSDSVSYNYNLPNDLTISTNAEFDLGIGAGGVVTNTELEKDTIISMLIHPKDVSAEDYFSSWFDLRIEPLLDLDESSVPEELVKLAENLSKDELAKACFDFVKSNIKYIDIENGINALIPRNCEKVLNNGLGDCKDMATLLTALYRYFDLEAYCSISRTNSKPGKFQFPAVHQANHMICSLRLNDEWFYLDPTEDACLFGDPSLQILGTEVFMIGHKTEYFQSVPETSRSECNIQFDYEFNLEDGEIVLSLLAKGKMNSTIYGIDLKTHDSKKRIEDIFEIVTELKWRIDSTNINSEYSSLRLVTNLDKSIYAKVGSKKMYDLSFLPSLRMMCLLFNSSPYPIIDSPIQIYLNFEDEILLNDSEFESISISQDSNKRRLKMDLELSIQKDEKKFEESQLIKDWKKFWSKPIITIE